ncbi:reprolysin-like metallopeptidase, partial [Acinetobacter baumannii]
TGSPFPVGDPYDIDYVAHEIGHQFGGPHTFNATTGSCNGNRSAANAVEPGSGVTIMAYAGICGSTNDLANNSIAIFHTRSFQSITTKVQS